MVSSYEDPMSIPSGGRSAKIRELRDVGGYRELTVTVSRSGDLYFNGFDDGPGAASVSFDNEYEWVTKVESSNVPAVISALGGDPAVDDVFDLLVNNFTGDRSSEPERLIRDLGIPHEFHSE